MNEKLISEFIEKKYNAQVTQISRLMGGMSNHTYMIEFNDKKYTFRIPGKGSEYFTCRKDEIMIMKQIEKYDFFSAPIYNDEVTGYKIAPYIEGKPLSEISNKPIEAVSKILKKVHSIEKFHIDYEPIQRLEKYEALTNEVDPVYLTLKGKWLEIYEDNLKNIELVPCHGDAQMSNFVLSETRIHLLDWEFAANNDPIYDIACFGNNNFDDAIELLETYFESCKKEEYQRLYAWRFFQCLQWHNVAKYKDQIGLSEDLIVDFNYIANSYLDKAKTFFQSYLDVSKGD